MSGSFLDTTIIVDLAAVNEPGRANADLHISNNPPAEACFYAFRELLAGHIQVLCDAHNALCAADNPAEAIFAILRRSKLEGRKRESKLQAIAVALKIVYTKNPTGGRNDVKREMLSALAVQAVKIWRKAQKLRNITAVQRLACFNNGSIAYGDAGELRGPRNSFECIKSERCAAAGYLFDNRIDIEKMIDALHPSNLDPAAAAKNENRKRRKALKELLANGPVIFNKKYCRALGDAYFAGMCPPAMNIVTTNTVDFVPLCIALGKNVVKP